MTVLSSAAMLGAHVINHNTAEIRVWAPKAQQVTIVMVDENQGLPMRRGEGGIWTLETRASAGDRYLVSVDQNKPAPDPVSRFLPLGIHGPTEIVDPEKYEWHDGGWRGLPLEQYVIYELHTGTFTPEGTFDAAIEKLGYLRELGITAIEIMPVSA